MSKKINQSDNANSKNNSNNKKKKESAWEFTRSMIILLAVVIIVKWFVCDIFFIPSGSMEQTLHGHPENGDRIFCTKLNYLWRSPERWEIFVFKFPYEQTPEGSASTYKGEHFIKRCVGLPGEEIALVGGDVFMKSSTSAAAKRLVKDNSTQSSIWLPVYNEDFTNITTDEFGYYWDIQEKDRASVSIAKGSFSVTATANPLKLTFKPHTRFGALAGIPDRYVRRQVVEFSCPVIGCGGKVRKTVSSPKMTARCPRCGEYLQESDVVSYDYRTGYPANYKATFEKISEVADPQYRGEWWHFVPDLRVECKATLATPEASLKCSIIANSTVYSALFTTTTVKVFRDDKLLKEVESGIKVAAETSIEFYHLDGQLRAYIDDTELFDIKADSDILSPGITSPEKTNITLDVSGRITISNINITRDIFYYNYRDSRGFFKLPPDGYMALGDNCPSSNDSRFWGPVPQKNLVGTAQFVWWPLHSIKMLH